MGHRVREGALQQLFGRDAAQLVPALQMSGEIRDRLCSRLISASKSGNGSGEYRPPMK